MVRKNLLLIATLRFART
jgi:hypothetical protein